MVLNRIPDGGRISAVKWGRNITGIVESSRVKYGGELQYYVRLDKPVMRHLDGFAEEREYALVQASDVLSIFPGEDIHAGNGCYEAVALSELKRYK